MITILRREESEELIAPLKVRECLATKILLRGDIWNRSEKVVLAIENRVVVGVATYCKDGDLGDYEF